MKLTDYEHLPIVQKCRGCVNTIIQESIVPEVPTVNLCRIYMNPEAKWSAGNCPLNTHLNKEKKIETKQMDPIKKSKRGIK